MEKAKEFRESVYGSYQIEKRLWKKDENGERSIDEASRESSGRVSR